MSVTRSSPVAAAPGSPGRAAAGAAADGGGGSRRALLLPCAFALALVALGLVLPGGRLATLSLTLVGAGAGLLAWAALLYLRALRTGMLPVVETAVHRHHWVQACAQSSVLLWWGWHVSFVYPYIPLILAQLLFAYGVDVLLSYTRRGRYALGFGPLPIVFSINLFLWFRPEWFHLQFAMIAVGYLAKEYLRWDRDGRSTHIFNPSSFPLALAALALILTGTSEITLGRQIVSSQFHVPLIYLAIFLAALPGQLLFGVARMTMTAVVTMVAISALYFASTGTYLFYDAHVPVPVFLGMHLLFTDPATSPRTGRGRVLFGILYAVGVTAFFVILGALGAPTYFDKLLPLPLLNLMVRRIDALAAALPLGRWGAADAASSATPRRNFVLTSMWAGTFAVLYASGGVGDRHPGQNLPFWEAACSDGSGRACGYLEYMKSVYCSQGSAWACNEWGVHLASSGDVRRAAGSFRRACDQGFSPACENVQRVGGPPGALVRAGPAVRDLPVVLGWKLPVRDRDPEKLLALACRQGWPGACAR